MILSENDKNYCGSFLNFFNGSELELYIKKVKKDCVFSDLQVYYNGKIISLHLIFNDTCKKMEYDKMYELKDLLEEL